MRTPPILASFFSLSQHHLFSPLIFFIWRFRRAGQLGTHELLTYIHLNGSWLGPMLTSPVFFGWLFEMGAICLGRRYCLTRIPGYPCHPFLQSIYRTTFLPEIDHRFFWAVDKSDTIPQEHTRHHSSGFRTIGNSSLSTAFNLLIQFHKRQCNARFGALLNSPTLHP